MRAAIAKVRGQLGREYDLIIGGKRVKTPEKIKSLNPSKPSRDCRHPPEGRQGARGARHEGRARRPSKPGAALPSKSAPALVFRVGDLMRQRKMEFMAWLVFEVSKNWAEADADISETIDFCEFYAREALRFAKAQTPDPDSRRARHAALHSSRCWRGDSAVEFSLRHHGRHDRSPPSSAATPSS